MYNNKTKIGIIGGDSRQAAVCSYFANANAECAVWGVDISHDFCPGCTDNIVKATDWRGALKEAQAVILPLPVSADGIRLNCEQSLLKSDAYIPRLTEIIQQVRKDTTIFGGRIPHSVLRFATEHNVRMIDYYEFEDFQIKNAVPTAEGAISVAISEMNITISGSNAGVLGYGRIGRTLATRLLALGSSVTCIARSKKDLAWAECDGCKVIKLNDFLNSNHSFNVIFNTVPYIIFDEKTISSLPFGQLFIDLASLTGGIDNVAAENHGIKVVKALSLPGKCSPKTAGKIIYESVKDILLEEGVL